MKHLALLSGFLLLTPGHNLFACEMSVPLSYAPTFLAPPVNGHYEKCESKPEEQCLCIDGINSWYAELVDNIVLDYVAKSQEESCVKAEYSEEFPEANLHQDCDNKFTALSCETGKPINNYELLQVYCATDVMKIDGKKLQENAEKKAAYEAKIAAEKMLESQIALVTKARACGDKAISYMSVRNAVRGLSNDQKKQIVVAFSDIKSLLEVGSLDAAKEEIAKVNADGTLVTEADKSEMIKFIEGCE